MNAQFSKVKVSKMDENTVSGYQEIYESFGKNKGLFVFNRYDSEEGEEPMFESFFFTEKSDYLNGLAGTNAFKYYKQFSVNSKPLKRFVGNDSFLRPFCPNGKSELKKLMS